MLIANDERNLLILNGNVSLFCKFDWDSDIHL